jgi:hypothetical protein
MEPLQHATRIYSLSALLLELEANLILANDFYWLRAHALASFF